MSQRLGKVAQLFAAGAEFLGVKTKMVREPKHPVKHEPGLPDLPGTGKTFNQPEGTGSEGSLVAVETVGVAGIAINQAAHGKTILHGRHR